MARRIAALLAVAALCATQAGCALDSSSEGATEPARVTFETTEPTPGEVAIAGPKVVGAGVTEITLRNSGTRPHDAQLIRVSGRRGADEVISNTIDTPVAAPFPDWIAGGGGIGAVGPGDSSTVTEELKPGTYYLLDSERFPGTRTPNARHGGVARFRVIGRATTAKLPDTQARAIVRDYGFELAGIGRGTNRVTFENDGAQLHQMVALPLLEGSTVADAKRYFTAEDGSDGPPPVDFGGEVSTAVIDAGERQVAELDFDKGRYALLCFVTNRDGGPTHAELGMVDELDVR